MDKIILNEFLGESADMGVTITNLNDLAAHINKLPAGGGMSMPILVHIQQALTALEGLSAAME